MSSQSSHRHRETTESKVFGDHERRLVKNEKRIDGRWIYVGNPDTDDDESSGGAYDITPEFENGWDNSGSDAVPMRFRRKLNGNLDIEGSVTGGDVGTTVFTLPEGYRPDYEIK